MPCEYCTDGGYWECGPDGSSLCDEQLPDVSPGRASCVKWKKTGDQTIEAGLPVANDI